MTSSLCPKIFNDPIHGHVELSPLSICIIDTPQFQRLRDISQLGGVYYVFQGASSKRFEHCIGVSYLARKFVSMLEKSQPELEITSADILCVEIAGLIHDLGHGMFSHAFDGKFLPRVCPSNFVHEHASLGIFDILIEENDLLPKFNKYGLDEDDIHFIKELVLGDEHEAPDGFEWKGRGDKTFLYDIVANKRNGIDVDKFDYFARDSHVLGIAKSFDCNRLMTFARVYKVDSASSSNYQICFHLKEAWNIFELFHTRYTLHKRAYQHKVSNAIELMIVEALVHADPYIFLPGKDGVLKRMSETTTDFNAYWKYSEYILKQIEHSYDKNLEAAKNMVNRIRKRDLFSLAGEILLSPSLKEQLKEALIIQQLVEIKNKNMEINNIVDDNDLFVTVTKLGYGSGGSDPVSKRTTFFKPIKGSDDEIFTPNDNDNNDFIRTSIDGKVILGVLPPDSVSRLIPKEFEEIIVRVFARRADQVRYVKALFDEWALKFLPSVEVLTPIKRKRDENEVENKNI